MPVLGGRLLPGLMVAAFATAAGAQQKACEIDEGTPSPVARAVLDLQLAQTNPKPEAAAKSLGDAVKHVTEGDRTKNPTGRAFVYGKTMVYWLAQPNMTSGMTTRGAVGFATEPTAPFDIIAQIDSAFTVVETANPECASSTAPWRQQKGWVDLVNKAIEFNNAGNTDSAVATAKRSLQLSRNMPYGYMVLAQAAQKANQSKEAIAFYKQAIGAANDTSAAIADSRRGLQMALGAYAADLAEAATGADKANFMAESKTAYAALAKDPGTKYADVARNGQARLATLSGDTTAIKGSYADQLANPGAFSYNSLMLAAVTAAKAQQTKDAIKLFEAAHAVNPFHRDVLYNLARLYLLDSAYQQGIPVARQLIAVDPSNPDNFQLIAIAYASMQKKYQGQQRMYDSTAKALGKRANGPKVAAPVMKAIIDSAARMNKFITSYADSTKVAVDSALKYNDLMMKLPARVSFSEFTPADGKTTLGGSISNQTDEAKTFNLKIEFVDKAGTVVSSQDVPVGPVGPHKTTQFTATGTGAGIVAFRYAPIS